MTKAIIRTAVEADCPAMLELIKELAILEKAPNEVTVSMEEFIDAGFGENQYGELLLQNLMGKSSEFHYITFVIPLGKEEGSILKI
ncbi:hypothetical protein L950_0215655 [Sphingobacterium sp. IITKGP-BTPF85]|nr:hypothetical protein L950_0215655 [Sphingobacterium sp. IITKGP-BTPF85]